MFRFSLVPFLIVACSVSPQTDAFSPVASTNQQRREPTPLFATSSSVVELLDSNFAELFQGDKPLLIDAYATWCGPCKLIEPVIARCAENWSDSLVVSRFNIDALQTDVKIELMMQQSMPNKLPSLILVHNGKATTLHSGVIMDDKLDDLLSQHVPLKTVVVPPPLVTAVVRNGKSTDGARQQQTSGFINFAAQEVDDYMLVER